MSGALAYHAVVHALEAKGGWTPARRFAASVSHALGGHLPYQRHYAAGLACAHRHMGEDLIEHAVNEQFALDLNPMAVAGEAVTSPSRWIAGFNDYNKTVTLGVRTIARPATVAMPVRQVASERQAVAVQNDLTTCRHATHALLRLVLQRAWDNSRSRGVPSLRRPSQVARLLGLEHSVMGEACLALETLGHIAIPDLAKELGCHQRTLERRLREDGLTAEMLRQTTRFLRALEGIRAGDSLAEVAVEAGYSDQAHMTRAFRASCGMSPSFFKKLLAREASDD